MRVSNTPRRHKNRSNSSRRGNNVSSSNFEGNGKDSKIKGNAIQVHEKYQALARDAVASGDIIKAEYYFQYAEHYHRVHKTNQSVNGEKNSRKNKDTFNKTSKSEKINGKKLISESEEKFNSNVEEKLISKEKVKEIDENSEVK